MKLRINMQDKRVIVNIGKWLFIYLFILCCCDAWTCGVHRLMYVLVTNY